MSMRFMPAQQGIDTQNKGCHAGQQVQQQPTQDCQADAPCCTDTMHCTPELSVPALVRVRRLSSASHKALTQSFSTEMSVPRPARSRACGMQTRHLGGKAVLLMLSSAAVLMQWPVQVDLYCILIQTGSAEGSV